MMKKTGKNISHSKKKDQLQLPFEERGSEGAEYYTDHLLDNDHNLKAKEKEKNNEKSDQ